MRKIIKIVFCLVFIYMFASPSFISSIVFGQELEATCEAQRQWEYQNYPSVVYTSYPFNITYDDTGEVINATYLVHASRPKDLYPESNDNVDIRLTIGGVAEIDDFEIVPFFGNNPIEDEDTSELITNYNGTFALVLWFPSVSQLENPLEITASDDRVFVNAVSENVQEFVEAVWVSNLLLVHLGIEDLNAIPELWGVTQGMGFVVASMIPGKHKIHFPSTGVDVVITSPDAKVSVGTYHFDIPEDAITFLRQNLPWDPSNPKENLVEIFANRYGQTVKFLELGDPAWVIREERSVDILPEGWARIWEEQGYELQTLPSGLKYPTGNRDPNGLLWMGDYHTHANAEEATHKLSNLDIWAEGYLASNPNMIYYDSETIYPIRMVDHPPSGKFGIYKTDKLKSIDYYKKVKAAGDLSDDPNSPYYKYGTQASAEVSYEATSVVGSLSEDEYLQIALRANLKSWGYYADVTLLYNQILTDLSLDPYSPQFKSQIGIHLETIRDLKQNIPFTIPAEKRPILEGQLTDIEQILNLIHNKGANTNRLMELREKISAGNEWAGAEGVYAWGIFEGTYIILKSKYTPSAWSKEWLTIKLKYLDDKLTSIRSVLDDPFTHFIGRLLPQNEYIQGITNSINKAFQKYPHLKGIAEGALYAIFSYLGGLIREYGERTQNHVAYYIGIIIQGYFTFRMVLYWTNVVIHAIVIGLGKWIVGGSLAAGILAGAGYLVMNIISFVVGMIIFWVIGIIMIEVVQRIHFILNPPEHMPCEVDAPWYDQYQYKINNIATKYDTLNFAFYGFRYCHPEYFDAILQLTHGSNTYYKGLKCHTNDGRCFDCEWPLWGKVEGRSGGFPIWVDIEDGTWYISTNLFIGPFADLHMFDERELKICQDGYVPDVDNEKCVACDGSCKETSVEGGTPNYFCEAADSEIGNYILNSGFEEGDIRWTITSGKGSVSGDNYHSGDKSLKGYYDTTPRCCCAVCFQDEPDCCMATGSCPDEYDMCVNQDLCSGKPLCSTPPPPEKAAETDLIPILPNVEYTLTGWYTFGELVECECEFGKCKSSPCKGCVNCGGGSFCINGESKTNDGGIYYCCDQGDCNTHECSGPWRYGIYHCHYSFSGCTDHSCHHNSREFCGHSESECLNLCTDTGCIS